ncbi:hypothetical protein GS896_27680 [Rhodococcus hoagii]|nr:hypothetical protein [Prescottella equi]MBM4654034.1 hypothetical protein [Prescottella equi]MBM4719703.1 hypothetical protein [Prescottella equi]NKR23500.1 hypothetical protein [Prescottella equi]NKT56346.1 hypothetical protein [Prescottella equi]
MSYDVFAAKVGDKITLAEPGRNPVPMTVWLISPAGSDARAISAGPKIHAHVRPGGYCITFDATSYHTPHIQPA